MPTTFDPTTPAAASPITLEQARALVRRVWGFEQWRPLQAEAIEAALAGRDLVAVLATGAGKSLCYQAPALLRAGLTVVVSPLISLMKDQVAGLLENGIAAAMLTSAQDAGEKRAVFAGLEARELKLLYVAPERLMLEGFLDELVGRGLSTLVVDEAHCISHWGHDFRPEYREVGRLRSLAPKVPIHAFTATASPAVRDDIVEQLALRDPRVLVGDVDRPNLTYRFRPRGALKEQVLAVIRAHRDEAGIVYCLRRKDVDELCEELVAEGVRAVPYHAGLEPAVRARNQELFVREEAQIVVATIAFGMGIDRSDVRFVVHASLPKGVEQFSQESGRAGRDGLPAECIVFYSAADYFAWRSLAERAAQESSADPQALEEQRRRVGEMLSFASGASCRHRFLVEHFGQRADAREGCGACDVCLGELAPVGDATIVAQKVLSCVVRVGQRFGAAHVADVLRGSKSERVRGLGHDRLSTFGLLAAEAARDVRSWIDQLIAQGHLQVDGGQYPTLSLTKTGVAILRGESQAVLWRLPAIERKSAERQPAAGKDEPPHDADLFERLRALRKRLASERGVPPYLIFNDRTLRALAAMRPSTREQLLDVPGIGERKAADLGPAFLAELEVYAKSLPLAGS